MKKLDKFHFLLSLFVICLGQLFLIACFIGDLFILNGFIESSVYDDLGFFPIIWAMIIEIVLIIFGLILQLLFYKRYKYGFKK